MKINWFTVIAQAVNFLILVWLLKRLLYKPILKAVDEREKKIAAQLNDAEDKKAAAQKEQDDFRQKNEAFNQQKKRLMDKAVEETAAERQKLLDEARNAAIRLSDSLEAASKESRETLNRKIVQKTQQEVFAIARKTLTDLASLSLEEQSVNIFIKQLNELKGDQKNKFIETFKSVSEPVLIRSAFDLPERQQTEIKKAVCELLGTAPPFQFKTTPDLISGIELSAKGYKLAWSISEYLNSLGKTIAETIKEKPEAAQTMHVEPEKKTDRDKKQEPETK